MKYIPIFLLYLCNNRILKTPLKIQYNYVYMMSRLLFIDILFALYIMHVCIFVKNYNKHVTTI